MFVKGDQFAEDFRGELIGEDSIRRAVALEHAVGYEPVRRPFGLDLLGCLPERQRLRLSEDVRQEHVVMAAERVQRLAKGDKVTRDEPGPLVDQLVEGVLPVGSRFAPVNRAGVVVDLGAIERDVLAVALHRQLL